MPKKRKSFQVTDMAEPLTVAATSADDLRAGLEEIKEYEGVIGYILRNAKSAAIDLKDPTKIIDYAVLSSSALDSSKELSELFDLGNVKNIIVEGKDVKVLALTSGENKISVFVEKDADYKKVLKKLHSL
jgi:predicted regulator of Ras-like GTPase activity (Roadblock/LC7/MglB family)